MNKNHIFNYLFSSLILLLCLMAPFAQAQQSGPAETKGLTTLNNTVFDLGPEIEEMQGRQLRMRILVLEPGGTIAVHKQIDRPEIIYILKGAVTEYQNQKVIQRNAGDSWTAGKEITHGVVNTGTEPATIIVADIVKVQ